MNFTNLIDNLKTIDQKNAEGTITLLSKARGWITVTPRGKNRKKAFENVSSTLISPVR